jgi:pimeloyl-ACP methyl ester carboxylesterase
VWSHGGVARAVSADNTTDHLIADIERLRVHLGIHRWLLAGWSWGTTLALAYAEQHPDRVDAMVLALVTTTLRERSNGSPAPPC